MAPDPIFADHRLAAIYDIVDPDRSDLDHYLALATELGARSVLDIGCGTGTFACLLASRGFQVTAIDPAQASLDVACAKPGADQVRWICGYAPTLHGFEVDLVTMTANVAQVFLDDYEWLATLHAAWANLVTGGHLVFETRRPEARAWERWRRELTEKDVTLPDGGYVHLWTELEEVTPPFVSFWHHYGFEPSDQNLSSRSVLRFRDRAEVEDSLRIAGFTPLEVREAPDRPGLEMVFVARKV
ncbi:MAG TPA: class I SAM-dependent methyltransferase [Acidimicrobiales bacterium]|nr:class I SAM-dependent methyltransferase [Acidimicrobiales bacterium]